MKKEKFIKPPERNQKSSILNIGDTVEVLWNDHKWYKAVIIDKNETHIVFDYGNNQTHKYNLDFKQRFRNISRNISNTDSLSKKIKLEPNLEDSNFESAAAAPLEQQMQEQGDLKEPKKTQLLTSLFQVFKLMNEDIKKLDDIQEIDVTIDQKMGKLDNNLNNITNDSKIAADSIVEMHFHYEKFKNAQNQLIERNKKIIPLLLENFKLITEINDFIMKTSNMLKEHKELESTINVELAKLLLSADKPDLESFIEAFPNMPALEEIAIWKSTISNSQPLNVSYQAQTIKQTI